ncbi:CHAT domain-containing protein [Streptomyces sp. NBC_00846]|uniref:CHAT domain-containing tetratricopeptide repeat protein n=1 Tax=Streptomyces sp. NBC_00846 TaxID=2975849 RepID=UPI00386A5863|nr:CHAT domain-containing protein [Streptomyces sp. NBC_00846]
MYPPGAGNSYGQAGSSAWDRFKRTRSLAELNDAISSFRAAVAAVPSDDAGRVPYLYDLLAVTLLRFNETREPADLDSAITAGREAVSLARTDSRCLLALGTVLLERFKVSEQKDDLDEAVHLARIAVSLPPSRSSDGHKALENLGAALGARFRFLGSVEDLEESIALERSAVALSRPGVSRKTALHRLSQSLSRLVGVTGRPEALEEAVALARRAVNARPREGSDQAQCLSGLGRALADRCELARTTEGMDEAISSSREALDMTPVGHPVRGTYLSELVNELALYGQISGSTAHLDEAVRLARASKERAGDISGPGAGADYDWILVPALERRYRWTGTVADLDEAVALCRAALVRENDSWRKQETYSGVLSTLLFQRHRQTGSLEDLDEAVLLQREVLKIPSIDRRRRASALNALGMLLWDRSRRIGDPNDIEESVACGREAVATGVHRSDRAMCLSNLGNALMARFERSGRLADLDEGIEVTRGAVAAAHYQNEDLARYNSNLAYALGLRFERTGCQEDLDEAVAAGRRSVSLISGNHPERARFLANLGSVLQARYEYAGVADDRSAATAARIEASAVDAAPVRQRLGAARLAAADLVASADVLDATDLLVEAVRLLPEVSPRRLARSDQEHALGGLAGLAREAASLVLADPRLPEADRPGRALSLLEAGRGVLISQALDGRDDLSELRRRQPDLASHFAELRERLDQLGEPGFPSGAVESGAESAAPVVGGRRQRPELAAEFAATLARIRALDGFGSFGLPPRPDELLGAAEAGPVVVLNVSAYGSHALLVTQAGVTALPLPDLGEQRLADRVDAFLSARQSVLVGDLAEEGQGEARMLSVLEWLWDAVAGPVLDALGCRSRPSEQSTKEELGAWSRVWWVPCGLLSLLPVHAAGHHLMAGEERCPRTVIDRVVSSYTPSLRTLIHTRRLATSAGSASSASTAVSTAPTGPVPRALVVAMPTTPGLPGMGRLPFVADEVRVLRRHFPQLTLLAGEEAALGGIEEPTKNSVLARLADHPIAHFSCHGASDSEQPSHSRLLLQDHESAPLTAASLTPVALDRAQLAYLSACSTAATWPVRLLDESIHLASAFQVAGFPHVISTLWEIDDQLSVSVADDFYANLCTVGGDFDISCAAHALHQAVRRARNGSGDMGPADMTRGPFFWASYVHIGV